MASSKIRIEDWLANQPWFHHLEPGTLQQLAERTQILRPTRGMMILQRGDPARGLFVIVHGQVKLALPGEQGNEKVMDVLGPGQTFGAAVMFMHGVYPVYAQATSDATLLLVSGEAIDELLAADPQLARRMLAGLSAKLHGMVRDVAMYSLNSATQRVVGFLLGAARADGCLELPAAKQVMASRLNLTPETFSRLLHRLMDQALIAVQGRQIQLLDEAALRRLMPEES